MARTLIDTRLWTLAYKRTLYEAESEPARVGCRAQQVILEARESDVLLLSAQLVAEIYHVLTARGRKVRAAEAEAYLTLIFASPSVEYRSADLTVVRRAASLSAACGVHIWDFLVVLPFEGAIDRLITTDPHFRVRGLRRIAHPQNPFERWETEGHG